MVTTLKMMPVAEAVSLPLRRCREGDGRRLPTGPMNESAKAMLDESARLTAALTTIRTRS
ncbi:hypothetical protein [Micromonospora zhanjiangensis]|uniref:Uncharacterized protein n=1 Tax=Micromonospora zhanjiangensis TaxID=1522057 RepID=A0ABV8KEI0_9ACTN